MAKIIFVWFTICIFIITGTEHSVANMYYYSIGLISKWFNPTVAIELNTLMCIRELLFVTIGNAIGGMLFVGTTYWLINKKEK